MELDSTHWPAFSRLIDRMLEQPAAQREAWVRALEGEDAALAPQLLELLHPRQSTLASDWLETLPKLSDFAAEPGPSAAELFEQPGDEIGPYRLVRLLGSGGMGSVWYAERTDRLMRRAVALKLPLAVPSRVLASRFEREREILASLVHPHIARLYDAGISAGGRAYLALEYVEGQDLDDYCDARRLGLAARVDLFLQVLRAVQYAHSRLVIHRDIKPPNILVTPEGYVRLLDFGVAKLLDSDRPGDAELTTYAGAAMTLAYASPEQIAGHAVSTATDVYSLGVVLYELLTGSRPYRLKRDSRAAMEEAILQADIALPSAMPIDAPAAAERGAAAARLHRELRGDLDAIVLKALQRDPAQRYATVAEFAEDLTRYRAGLSVQAHRPSPWYQFRKFVVRNRLVVGSASAAALALLVGSGVALWQAQEAERQARIAATERDRALAAAGHREAVEEFLSDLLLDAGRTGRPVSISTLIARADELSQREFVDNPEVRAAVLRTVGDFELDFQGVEQALRVFDQAQQLLAKSQDSDLRDSVACSRAMIAGAVGRAEESARGFRAIIDDPAASPDALRECLGDEAQLYIYRFDGARAAADVTRALREWELAPRRSPVKRLELLDLQARARALNDQPAAADADLARILGELKALGRDRGSWADRLRNDRILAAMEGGELNGALAQIEEAIAILAQDVPDRPPLMPLFDRALVLSYLGRYREALAGFERVALIAAAQDKSVEQWATFNAAAMKSRLGAWDDAERDYRRAVDIGPPPAKQGSSDAMVRLLTRAKLDLDRREFAAARDGLARILEFKSVPPASLAAVHRFRAQADLGAGDAEQALRDARLAVDADLKVRGDRPYSAWVGQSQLALGQALLASGSRADGWRALDAAVEQLSQTVGHDHPALAQARQLLRGLAQGQSGPVAGAAVATQN